MKIILGNIPWSPFGLPVYFHGKEHKGKEKPLFVLFVCFPGSNINGWLLNVYPEDQLTTEALPDVLTYETSGRCLGKGFVVPLAVIRFLTRVAAKVNFQRTFSRKAPVTLTALIRLFTRVNTLMFGQITTSRKASVTSTALIRLLTRVDTLVHCQIPFFCKAFITLTADI